MICEVFGEIGCYQCSYEFWYKQPRSGMSKKCVQFHTLYGS